MGVQVRWFKTASKEDIVEDDEEEGAREEGKDEWAEQPHG